MEHSIVENITKYRKAAGLTQEQLGDLLGVSGQAVSKWENGGYPDAYLLPKLSAALGVSIDTLFGIEKSIADTTENEILDYIFDYCKNQSDNKKSASEKFDFLFRAMWAIQCGYISIDARSDLEEIIEINKGNPQITSQIIDNAGTTYLSLVKDFPIFCAVKDTKEISSKILNEEDFPEFFSLLSDPDSLKAVIFTQSADCISQYTEKALSEKIGISQEKLAEIMPLLVKYGFLHEDSLMLDDKAVKIYHKWSNPEIRPILMMAYQYIHARQCYYNFVSNRTKPYFDLKQ